MDDFGFVKLGGSAPNVSVTMLDQHGFPLSVHSAEGRLLLAILQEIRELRKELRAAPQD